MAARQEATPTRAADILGLVVFGALVAIAALIGGLAAAGSSAEYDALEQPVWAPPSWLFTPVWTILYIAIAVAAWLVWRRAGVSWPLLPWIIQLVLNAAWTPLFFGMGEYGWAAVEITVMWLAIGATVFAFWRVHRGAALLMIPYWVWVTYAGALNVAIWSLN